MTLGKATPVVDSAIEPMKFSMALSIHHAKTVQCGCIEGRGVGVTTTGSSPGEDGFVVSLLSTITLSDAEQGFGLFTLVANAVNFF